MHAGQIHLILNVQFVPIAIATRNDDEHNKKLFPFFLKWTKKGEKISTTPTSTTTNYTNKETLLNSGANWLKNSNRNARETCTITMRMPLTTAETLRAWILSALVVHGVVGGNPDAKRLYDDLLSNYNKLVRPVVNTSDVLKVSIKLKLSQLIDVVSFKCQQFPFVTLFSYWNFIK